MMTGKDGKRATSTVAILPAMLCAAVVSLAAGNGTVIDRDTVFAADVEVPEAATLIIRPGVTITFSTYSRLAVGGLLIAEGTAGKPVLFTATGRPRGSQALPDWKGIEIIGPKAYGRLRHVRIEGAFRNLVWGNQSVFDSCEFAGNHYALYCAKQSAANVSNSRFYNNVYGITVEFAAPLLLNNIITDNSIGICLRISGESVTGRNRIVNNRTDIKVENAFGENKQPASIQYLWEVMNQLY